MPGSLKAFEKMLANHHHPARRLSQRALVDRMANLKPIGQVPTRLVAGQQLLQWDVYRWGNNIVNGSAL